MSDPNARLFKLLRMYCEVSAMAAVALGCLVLGGWAFHIELLKSVLPGLVAVKVNTALGLVFSGTSLLLLLPGESSARTRHIARVLALLVTLIGAATLSEYLFRLDLRIDQLLFVEPAGAVATYSPGRMSPTTSTAFLAIGLALLLLDWKTRRGHGPAQVLSLWGALVAMMAISGYIYNATALYRILLYTQMALHTAIALLLLSSAIFFARPRTGMAGDLTGQGSGSVMARRFLPVVFFVPVFLGWIRLRGQLAGFYGTELGLALYATSNVIVFAILVWLNARRMNKEYDQRSRAELEIRELNAVLEERVAERTGSLEREISVRKQAEARLRLQSMALNAADNAMVITERDLTIVWTNPAFTDLTGYTDEEAVGSNVQDLIRSGVHAPAFYKDIGDTLLAGESWRGEMTNRRKDGRLYPEAQTITPVKDDDGTISHFIAIKSDLTAQHQVAAQLRQAQKMEAVGQLAAGMAHEFNNLLQALMSMASIVRLRAGSAEVAQLGTEMESQIKRGASLTQQLLLFSRNHAIEKSDLDLREQVQKASLLLRQLIPQNIRIVVETSPERLSVECDSGQMQQVLLNLAINARDVMPDGGTLTLRAGASSGEVFLEVEDTGYGMDEATRARIFEPFFTTKEMGKGTGLGLAVVHGIVEDHGGRIDVRSRPGQGSCIRVVLPASVGADLPTLGPSDDADMPVGSGRVLLVEDQEGVRDGITVLLEMIGYEVTAVGSGEEAIALALEPAPDLLLSDITLPGIAGPTLGERLCERWPTLKVVLMSGYLEEALRAKARDREWHFLQKPFEMADLASHLQAALDGKMPGTVSSQSRTTSPAPDGGSLRRPTPQPGVTELATTGPRVA
jgi:two-component system cell cycle sensor histidine kinase/response regulator CckA